MTDRAGRWVTEQVGRYRRTVNDVAVELGLRLAHHQRHRHPYGTALVDDSNRIGTVTAFGLDDVVRAAGRWRRQPSPEPAPRKFPVRAAPFTAA